MASENYKHKQYTVKHNSIIDFIEVYFLQCFFQRHVLALVMSYLEPKHVVERNNVRNTP